MSCPEFIAQSFAVRTATHLMHLTSSRYAEHVALNEFYDALLPLVDRYAEVYMGLERQVKSFPSVSPPTGAALKVLGDYLEQVQDEQEEDSDSQALVGILAELEELTAQTIYKLRFLA